MNTTYVIAVGVCCFLLGWMQHVMCEDAKWISYNHANGRPSMWRPKQWSLYRTVWGSWWPRLIRDKEVSWIDEHFD